MLPKRPPRNEILPVPECFPEDFSSHKEYQRECARILEENTERFEKAGRTIRWCDFLQHLLHPLQENIITHYAWCPLPYWEVRLELDELDLEM